MEINFVEVWHFKIKYGGAKIPDIYGLVPYKVPYNHDSKVYKVC